MDAEVQDIERACQWLATTEQLTVLTGAGVSAESGVPTFRGKDGLWRGFRATDLATPEAFARDPKQVWAFYNWRRQLLASLKPNPAHEALVRLEAKLPQFILVTQNIDDLHRRAGTRKLIELHGNIWMVRCTGCQTVSRNEDVWLPELPSCDDCGALLRPHVVWFGEQLQPAILKSAVVASRTCQTMLVIGTSAIVQPAASLAIEAKAQGARVIEVNLEPTVHSHHLDLVLQGKAGVLLPQLLEGW
ncbi:MAG: NAD-dependent deacylase [Deltaproteobacteria bacterium]|nr:MAG: NAD-dependent deacylase [Deltaproteobacteria bacterium]